MDKPEDRKAMADKIGFVLHFLFKATEDLEQHSRNQKLFTAEFAETAEKKQKFKRVERNIIPYRKKSYRN